MCPLFFRSIASITCLALVILTLSYPNSSKADRLQLVLLTASVIDENGDPVTNLRHTDFEVFDNEVRQSIAFFSREDEPLSIAVVFDLSISLAKSSPTWFSAVCQGLFVFKEQSNQSSEYTIIGADREPLLITDWTSKSDVLIEGLSRLALLQPKSRTRIYDACQLALKKISDRDTGKNAVLLITDGRDGASSMSLSELSDLAQRSNASIYLVCPWSISRKPLFTNEQKMLATLSLDSGASAFFPASDPQVEAAFGAIANGIRKQYDIGYYALDNRRDGSWHHLRVTLTPQLKGERNNSDFHVRTRSGYYAPNGPR